MAASDSLTWKPKFAKSASSTSMIMTRSRTKNQCESSTESLDVCWWEHLPDEALIRVYEYLGENDRASTALVCKHWSVLFRTPTLWRERHFVFAGPKAMTASKKARSFIKLVGPHLRRLVLECGQPVYHTAKPIAGALASFLVHACTLPNMKISSLKIVYLDCVHSWRFFDVARGKLVNAIVMFLNKQKYLQHLDISGAHFPSREAISILQACAVSPCIRIISCLQIKDMFEPGYRACQDDRFQKILASFVGLRELYVNYNYINDDILSVFCESHKSTLRYLRVVVDSTEPCTHAVTAFAWRQFCESCSNAKVAFHFLGKLGLEEYQRVFVKYIPMNEIDILSWNRYFNDRQPLREDIPHILTHVGVTYPQLAKFCLSCDYLTEPGIDESLLCLMEKCSNLRTVCINTAINTDTVEKICALLMKKQPRVLEHLELKVRDLSPDQLHRLRSITVLTMDVDV